MFKFIFSVLFLLVLSCGEKTERKVIVDKDDKNDVNSQLVEIKNKIKELELFANTYSQGIDNPFTDCETVEGNLEKKICEIAQTVSTIQQSETKMQLGVLAKEFQVTLYGTDCVNATDPGCPVTGCLVDKVTKLQVDMASAKGDISSISSQITTIQSLQSAMSSRLDSLESRLDNFNGTSQSIEDIISGIQVDVSSLQSDVSTIKGVLSPSKIINQYLICGDNPDSGPYYELLLISGDKTKAYGSVKSGTWYGQALFFSAGDVSTGYDTHLNSKTCHFKMYNDVTGTKIQACWIRTSRMATNAQIDAARSAGTATCTDY